MHLAPLRDVVPQLFELNGPFDVPARPDGGRAFTAGRDLGWTAGAPRGLGQQFFSGVPELRRVRAAIDHHLREQLGDTHRDVTRLSNRKGEVYLRSLQTALQTPVVRLGHQ